MLIEALLRAAYILRSQPGYTMPLARLHAQLTQEFGAQAGSYSEIYQQLQKHADSFLVLDSARRLGGTENWPRAVREEYNHALDEAGLGCCVRVTLTDAPPPPEAETLLAALNNTMADLVAGGEHDAGIQEFLVGAKEQLADLTQIMLAFAAERPTTPLPDLPSAG